MTWLNRGFKIRHKFIKERDMKAEAIRALELFKQQHLARPAVEATNGQADMVSESQQTKENQMEQRDLGELLSTWEEGEKAKKQKGVNFNYPDHIVPLKQRMMSALNNGARTVETVARYCKETEKLINLQLNRLVSRGMIGKQTTKASGITRYYPYEIAKEMGILTAPQPINRKKKAKATPAHQPQPTQAEAFVLRGETVGVGNKSQAKEAKYIEFLEKRIVEWQVECRKLANENEKIKDALGKSLERRNVTSEVTEVMKEVMELRATVAYLESKLFGRK